LNPAPSLNWLRQPRTAWPWAAAGIVLAGALVYANSFAGPFVFDDLISIGRNPSLRGFWPAWLPPGGGLTVSGRPVLNESFALNHAISGERVWSYHAVNLAIHLLAGLTLLGIVRRTLRGRFCAEGEATVLAFGAALLWTVHPLQTESVTYIVQRAESLMGLFYLLTLYAFIRGAENGSRGKGWFGVSFASCLFGMGTKEVMVSAPVLVVLYDRTFISGTFREAWRRHGRVHGALALTWIPLAALVLQGGNRGGTAGFGVGVHFWRYAATQFQAVAHYLWLAVWPHPLIVDYGVQWVKSPGEVIPYAVVVLALAAATVAALIRRPALGFMGFWFFAILAPTSLVPGTRQTLAEHRMYLALAPLAVGVVLALHRWLGRRAWVAWGAVAVGLGWATVQRNAVYRTDEGLWADTVAHRPGNAAAHNNYGNILATQGKVAEALEQYAAAVRIDPDYADAYFDAGKALSGQGRDAEAAAWYERAVQLRPGDVDARNAEGLALAGARRLPEAIAAYDQALRADPGRADVRNNLGNALMAAGRKDEAIAQYEAALRLNPSFAEARNNLGNAYRDAGRLPEAIAQYEQALEQAPDSPAVRTNLGIALLMAGRTNEAIDAFERALRANPAVAQAHVNLAIALERAGRDVEAQEQIAEAQRLGAREDAGR
jgi:tetratricopeptide (TPR) repeat protein